MSAVTFEERYWYSQGQYRRIALVIAVALGLFAGMALFVVGWPAAALLGTIIIGAWLVWQPRQGFYSILAAVIIIEGSSGLPFVVTANPMYGGIDDLVGPSVPFSPLELGMGLLILGTIKQAGRANQLRLGEFFWPLLFLSGMVLLGLFRGMNSGGDGLIGFREIRALLYLLPMYFLTVNLVRERRHFNQLAVVLVLAVSAMAAGAMWTHLALVRTGTFQGIIDLGFAHENAIFAGLVVIFMVAMMVWGKGFGPRFILVLPGVLALAAILVMKRRVGLIALDAGLVLLGLVLLRNNWRLFLVAMPIVMVAAVIYLGIFWNATGGLGQGARAFRTVIGQEAATEDLSSKLYREREAFNVEMNIRWQPFWGSGFGKPYAMPEPLPDLTSFWPMQPYIPHNTILWTWMKGGILTFILVLAFFGHAMIRGLALARRRLEPLLQAWAAVAAASVLMVFLFAWQDLGLTSLRTLIVFGFCLGLITVIGALPEYEERPKDNQADVDVARRSLQVKA